MDPIGAIRDREQWRSKLDQAATAYLKATAANPQHVMTALSHVAGQPKPPAD